MNTFEVATGNPHELNLDASRYLSELFKPGSENHDKLKYELQREFRFNGSPEVTSMRFDRVSYNPVSGKGSFRVILDINYTFGCEDVTTCKNNQTSDWTFEVDRDASVIRFYSSPYAEARSTADEF